MHRCLVAVAFAFTIGFCAVAVPMVSGEFAPYRVYQVNEEDTASIALRGAGAEGAVEARWVGAGHRETPWHPMETGADGAWTGTLAGIPVGGPYTLELREAGADAVTSAGPFFCGDLWILAGQSNMQGVGNNLAVTPPHPRVMVFAKNDEWRPAEEPLHRLAESPDVVHNRREQLTVSPAPAVDVTGWTKGAGLGLQFATGVTEATGRPIGLVACAHGGTSMDQWDPAKRDEGGASLYGSMYRRLQLVGGEVTGVLWYQGESDARENTSDEYKDKFRAFIEAVRRDGNDPALPFYFVQIGRFTNPGDSVYWDRVQHTQYELGSEMEAVEVVASIDLGLDDRIHIDTPGLQVLGDRLARLALSKVYGVAAFGSGPRLEEITRGSNAFGHYYRLAFAVPNGALQADGPVTGFGVYDADGAQQVYRQERDPLNPAGIRLWVNTHPENGTLHYGRGFDPVCTVRDSAGFALPVFGPIPLPK